MRAPGVLLIATLLLAGGCGTAWIAARNRLGSAATYGQEFLRRIGRESGAWRSVFATPYAEFVDEFRARLQRLE